MPFFPQFSNLFVAPYIPPAPISPINPNEILNLALWLKSDVGVSYDENNLVTLWEDQSGNGLDASPPSEEHRPEYIEDFINGNPAIYFDGTDYLTFSYTSGSEYTFFNVVKFISGNRVISSVNTNVLIGSYDGFSDVVYGGGAWVYQGTSTSTDWKLNALTKTSGNLSSFYQNSILLGSASQSSVLDTVAIGGDPNWENGNGTAECYHAEIVIYDRVLTENELAGISLYFNNKYAIY